MIITGFSCSCFKVSAADWLPTLSGTVSPELDDFVGNISYSDSVDPITFSYTLANETSPDPQRGWVTGTGDVKAGAIVVFVNIDLEQAGFRDVGPGRGFVIKGRFGYSPAAAPLPSDASGQISIISGEYVDVQNLVYQSFHFENDNVSGITTLGSQGMFVMDYELQLFVPLYNDDGTPNTATYDQVDLSFRITPSGSEYSWIYPWMYFSPVTFSEYDDVTIYGFGSDLYDSGLSDAIGGSIRDEEDLKGSILNGFNELGINPYDWRTLVPNISNGLSSSFVKLRSFTSNFLVYLGADFSYLYYFLIFVGAVGLVLGVVSIVTSSINRRK